ncbi:MAG: hypothetical protein RMN25_05925, partial [Anaerolineae bacterium]|nr:hypothetical protein [Thermoflexales bacterium]MDW8407304.1 hypothetical protein [Anaerolineae bacterium]
LAHAGLPFNWFDTLDAALRSPQLEPSLDILIVALARDDADTARSVLRFAEDGGVVVLLANIDSLAPMVGCRAAMPVSVGYAEMVNGERLRFLSAVPWAAVEGLASTEGILRAGAPDGPAVGAVIVRVPVGVGVIQRWAVDVATTVTLLQQGLGPVTQDGLPAPDGSAPLDEGILKADDGFSLDWVHDRVVTDTGQPYFAHPYADLWREVFIHHLIRLALSRNQVLPVIDYWPAGVSCVATVSHDSDLNTDDSAETTLDILRTAGIQSTWCIIEPGYTPSIYARILSPGHELAFHYNAVVHEGKRWDQTDFHRQLAWFKRATGIERVVSNKNHYTRFEGWGELFRWLETEGVHLDQTRGPSKRGNVGLLFGTCHPYFPIAWHDEANRLYDVIELGFLTQDMELGNWADKSVIGPFLDQTQRMRGVAHFLFHPVHLHAKPPVRMAFDQVVDEARRRGFVFWTAQQINAWTRARRKLRVETIDQAGRAVVSGAERETADRAVVWVPVGNGHFPDAGAERRFGVWCRRMDTVIAP